MVRTAKLRVWVYGNQRNKQLPSEVLFIGKKTTWFYVSLSFGKRGREDKKINEEIHASSGGYRPRWRIILAQQRRTRRGAFQ